MPGKVKNKLGVEQYKKLLADLARISADPTHEQIAEICSDYGVTVSPGGKGATATVYSDFEEFVKGTERLSQIAEQVTAIQAKGGNFSAATLAGLRQRNFELMLELGGNPKVLNIISVIEARITEAEQNAQRIGQAERDLASKIAARDELIAQYKRREVEWNEAREKLAAAAAKLREGATASDDEKRTAVLDEMDRIMGLKK